MEHLIKFPYKLLFHGTVVCKETWLSVPSVGKIPLFKVALVQKPWTLKVSKISPSLSKKSNISLEASREILDFLESEGEIFDTFKVQGFWTRATLNRGIFPTDGTLNQVSLQTTVPWNSSL